MSEESMSEESMTAESVTEESQNDTHSDDENNPKHLHACTKLQFKAHVNSFMKNNKLCREVETLSCSAEVIEKVVSNYIIVKQILSSLSWQDKLLCKQVCSTWHSAVQALQRDRLGPVDFMLNLRTQSSRTWAELKCSGSFSTEPLVAITFLCSIDLDITCRCNFIEPVPCDEPCKNYHSLLDALQMYTTAPKNCMSIILTDNVTYMPLPKSATFPFTCFEYNINPCMVGMYIPAIPDVKFQTINIKSLDNLQEEFYDAVQDIGKDRIFKGIFVYATDKFALHSVEDVRFLSHFKEVQPDIPYAFGGSVTGDAFEQSDICAGVIDSINNHGEFMSLNLLSINVFTIPKTSQVNEFKFDMYSLVLDLTNWTKDRIEKGILEFSNSVPRFQYSVAIKYACISRDEKHKREQNCFRAAFPNTRIIGCYGQKVLGDNHPPKPYDERKKSSKVKRRCTEGGPKFDVVYSHATVFVYMGWGKKLPSKSS